MKHIVSILLLLISNLTFGQIQVVKNVHDFGQIDASADRFTDFEFVNTSGKDAFLLRIDNDPNTSYLFAERNFPAGTTYTLRVQYNPKKKGDFKVNVDVYFSALMEPITITLQGSLSEMPSNRAMECPTFQERKHANFAAEVQLVDNQTSEPIKDGKIIMIGGGGATESTTDKKGTVKYDLTPGLYKAIGQVEGYDYGENQGYLNPSNPKMEVRLAKVVEEELVEVVPEPAPIADETSVPAPEPETVVEETKVPDAVAVPREDPIPDPQQPLTQARSLASANFVFLVDVSSSMAKYDKMELLQTTLLSIMPTLDQTDRISMVKYATNAYVMIDSISSTDKQQMIDSVQALKSYGFTKGEAGLFLAYDVAEKNYIAGGINQVVLLTDGAFNLKTDDANLVRMARRKARDGVELTVVGIRASQQSKPSLLALEKAGNGAFLDVRTPDDANSKLLEHWVNKSR